MKLMKLRDKQIKTTLFDFGTATQAAVVTVKGGGTDGGIFTVEGNVQIDGDLLIKGTPTMQVTAELQSDLIVSDELLVNGNARLGDAATDIHRILGRLAIEKGQVTTWYDNSETPVSKVTINGATGAVATAGTVTVTGISTLNNRLNIVPIGGVGDLLVVGNEVVATDVTRFYTDVVIGTVANTRNLTVNGAVISLNATNQNFSGDVAFADDVVCGDADVDVVTIRGILNSTNSTGDLVIDDSVKINQTLQVVGVSKFDSNTTIVNGSDLIFASDAVGAVVTAVIDAATGNIDTVGDIIVDGTVDNVDISLASNFVFNEVSTTVPDGVVTTFAVVNEYLAGKISVYLNGQWLRPGADYDYVEGVARVTVVLNEAPTSADDVVSFIYVKKVL